MWLAFDRWRINDLGESLMPLAATSRLRRQRHVASGRRRGAPGHSEEAAPQGTCGPAVVRSQCRRHPGPGRRSQIRQGQKLWADCALVALAMALFFALLRAAKPTDIEALIG